MLAKRFIGVLPEYNRFLRSPGGRVSALIGYPHGAIHA
jgi:hypothetical protein